MASFKIADLFAGFGIRVDKRSVDNVEKTYRDSMGRLRNEAGKFVGGGKNGGGIKGVSGALEGLQTTARKVMGVVGLYFGAKAAGGALLGFNSTVEETKTQIAGMLALTRKTDLNDQLKDADTLYASIQKRAESLPGSTAEYASMLGNLVQPLSTAKASLKDMENMSIAAVQAGKAFGFKDQLDMVARDIDQALSGKFSADDAFAGKLLRTIGYQGEKGRDKFNKLSEGKRFAEVRRALGQKQFQQMGEAQGKSFAGLVDQMKEKLAVFLGRVGLPLFKALGNMIGAANVWLEAHKAELEAIATAVGEALVGAFAMLGDAIGVAIEIIQTLVEVFEWFREHADFTLTLIITALILMTMKIGLMIKAWWLAKRAAIQAWIAMLGPWALLAAAIAAVIYVVIKLIKHADEIKEAFLSAVEAIASAFASLWEGMKAGARAAWQWIRDNVPLVGKVWDTGVSIKGLVKQASGAAEGLVRAGEVERARAAEDAARPAMSVPWDGKKRDSDFGGPQASSMSVRDINVNIQANGADAKQVAEVFDERLKRTLGNTGSDFGLPAKAATS